MAFTNSKTNDNKFSQTLSPTSKTSKDEKTVSSNLNKSSYTSSLAASKNTSTSSAFSKTSVLTTVSSATAARPSALKTFSSSSTTTTTPAPRSTTSSTISKGSALDALKKSTAATTTTSTRSAFSSTTATASRPSTLSSSTLGSTTKPSTLSSSSSTLGSNRASTLSSASSSFSANRTTSLSSSTVKLNTTTRPSTLSSTTSSLSKPATTTSTARSTLSTTSSLASKTSTLSSTSSSTASRLGSTTRPTSTVSTSTTSRVTPSKPALKTNPVGNDEFAKKIAETKAALSSMQKVRATSTDSQGNATLIKENQEVTDVQYRRFAAFIEEKCGIVLGSGKQYLVNSRLSSLLPKFRVSTVDELINKAMEDVPNNKIQEEVVDAMTTNETLWFRDTYPYTALETLILPELAKKAKYPVRIWSAACSSGQEPYSIGMIVQEQLGKMLHIDPKQTQIIGSDLSPEMLSLCRTGHYDVHALSRGLSAERKSKFFKPTHKPNIMQIDHRVKSMVEFRPMNLLGSYALMGKFDVIFCRNVLIYFSNDVKAEILRKLTMCLNPGGYLILGSTETLVGVADKFEMVRCNPGIIYRLKPQKYAFGS